MPAPLPPADPSRLAPPPALALPDALLGQLRQAAAAEYPREACGLVVRDSDGSLRYQPCRNAAPAGQARDRFLIDPLDWVLAEAAGELVAVFHTHPDASAHPSHADRLQCELGTLPWLILAWPGDVLVQLHPEGWKAPLIGREFHFGLLDCYTLIRDYYRQELAIALPDFEREDAFWERGEELYLQGFERAGFVRVEGAPQRHDVLLMQVRSDVTNHGAIYLGDELILHHLYGQLSRRDPWGGYWRSNTRLVVRHQRLLGGLS